MRPEDLYPELAEKVAKEKERGDDPDTKSMTDNLKRLMRGSNLDLQPRRSPLPDD